MNRIPATRSNPIGFKGRASSEVYNQQTEETYLDILELYDAANEIEAEIEELQEAFQLNKQFQHIYIQKMQNRIRQLVDVIEKRVDGETHHVHTIYADEMRHDPNAAVTERAFLDSANGVAHLPLTKKTVSKLYLSDAMTGDISLPKALRVAAHPEVRLGSRIEENDPLLAVDGKSQNRWRRKVILPLEESPKDGVTTEVVVTLPDTIISSRDANMFTLKTFPVNSLWVEKVEYRLDGDWKLIPGWPVDAKGEPVAKEDVGNLKLCFPETAMAEVRVTLKQYNWFEENGEKVYYFGLEEIGVFHADFQSQIGKIDIPVTLRGDTETKVLRGLKPILENADALSGGANEIDPVISYSIYTVDDNNQLHYTKDAFPVVTTHGSVLIRAVIHADRYNGATPVLSAVELAYDNVY